MEGDGGTVAQTVTFQQKLAALACDIALAFQALDKPANAALLSGDCTMSSYDFDTKVHIGDASFTVHVQQEAKTTVWVASGRYKSNHVQTRGQTWSDAVRAWRAKAIGVLSFFLWPP
jgi:hypothetical protein